MTTLSDVTPNACSQTKQLLSTTQAHSDFLKTLLVFPKLNLLVSASSDRVLRLWYTYHTVRWARSNFLVTQGSFERNGE
jgi:hypothetical protein